MARNRLVPLTPDLPEDEGFPVQNCNHCAGEGVDRKAVIALEHEGKIHRFYGLCGNHAEVSPYTEEWTQVGRARK